MDGLLVTFPVGLSGGLANLLVDIPALWKRESIRNRSFYYIRIKKKKPTEHFIYGSELHMILS